MQVCQGPLAVARVDAEGELHLLVEHHEDPHSLLLWGPGEREDVNTAVFFLLLYMLLIVGGAFCVLLKGFSYIKYMNIL